MDPKISNSEHVQHPERNRPRRNFYRILIGLILFTGINLAVLVAVVSVSPKIGAQGANTLRSLFGPEAVAKLESMVFTIQDGLEQLAFRVEHSTPVAPWTVSTAQADAVVGISLTPTTGPESAEDSPTLTYEENLFPSPSAFQAAPKITGSPDPNPLSGTQLAQIIPAQTPTPEAWKPVNVPPMGMVAEEGTWIPYILDASGNTLAYRTFLQADRERLYALVGIVALDLNRVRLHFQPGFLEPKSTAAPPRTGEIPESDLQPGILLAAFNGGFKTLNGHFGVFVDGVELLPPKVGFGTLAIFENGSVQIGEWGTDFIDTNGISTYRQNCPLVVHDGEINPLVFSDSVNDWGGTVSNNIVTYRSGVGLSQDGQTLYYFAGNNLSMTVLAEAMQAAGAYQAMQLDINSYYVLFTRFTFEDGVWSAEPLMPKEMIDNVARYLGPSPHDFFYLTAIQP